MCLKGLIMSLVSRKTEEVGIGRRKEGLKKSSETREQDEVIEGRMEGVTSRVS